MADLPIDGIEMRPPDGFDVESETGVFRDAHQDLVVVRLGWEVFRIYPDGRLKITDLEALVKWLSSALWKTEQTADMAAAFRRLADELEKRTS